MLNNPVDGCSPHFLTSNSHKTCWETCEKVTNWLNIIQSIYIFVEMAKMASDSFLRGEAKKNERDFSYFRATWREEIVNSIPTQETYQAFSCHSNTQCESLVR